MTLLLTSCVAFVGVVDLLQAAVAEGQLAHPLHPSLDSGGGARPSSTRAREAVRGEVVVAEGQKQLI